MKKLIGIAAFILASSSFAQGVMQNQHPDQRNDQQEAKMHDMPPVQHAKKRHAKRHVKKHHHHKLHPKAVDQNRK